MKDTRARPYKSIFEYDNYREFLKDYYARAKIENKTFSFGFFSKLAGFKSRSVLQQVMNGERNIAPTSIAKFTKALKLNKEAAVFFKNLVLFNQATSPEEKRQFAQEIIKSKAYQRSNPIGEAQYNYASHWYFVAIRELAALPGFKAESVWIAKHVFPSISVPEAKYAVDELIKLGYLKRDNEGGLRATEGWLATADEVTSAAIIDYHRAMLNRASESIERFPREKRDISAQTFGVSPKTMQTIKEMIQVFRKEIESVVSRSDEEPDAVYQLNFQFFPIAGVDDD